MSDDAWDGVVWDGMTNEDGSVTEPVTLSLVKEGDKPKGVPAVIRRKASSFAIKGVRWAYEGRIPVGMVTMLAGREGIGKSTVALDLASRITRGRLEGRYEGSPQNVVICATEDSWEHTIVPRLVAVGADLERVEHISVQNPDGSVRAISAPGDIRRMEEAFAENAPRLLILDPLMAVLDGKVDSHKQAEVQQALEPLVAMCDRIELAVLALIHVNKSTGTDPLTSIMGSRAFATLPRSVLFCVADNEEEDSYLFGHPKCNVGPKMPSIGYRLDSVRVDLPAGQVEEGEKPFVISSRVVWGDVDMRTVADVITAGAEAANLGDASQDVLSMVDAAPDAVTVTDIAEKLAHLTKNQIRNATSRLAKAGRIDRVSKGIYGSTRRTL